MANWATCSKTFKQCLAGTKKASIKIYLRELRSVASDFAEIEAIKAAQIEGATFTPFDRAQWARLDKNQRKQANQYYMKVHGKTVEEMGEYRKGILIGRLLGRKPLLSLIPTTP